MQQHCEQNVCEVKGQKKNTSLKKKCLYTLESFPCAVWKKNLPQGYICVCGRIKVRSRGLEMNRRGTYRVKVREGRRAVTDVYCEDRGG